VLVEVGNARPETDLEKGGTRVVVTGHRGPPGGMGLSEKPGGEIAGKENKETKPGLPAGAHPRGGGDTEKAQKN